MKITKYYLKKNEGSKMVQQQIKRKKKRMYNQRCLSIPLCNCWKCQINNI